MPTAILIDGGFFLRRFRICYPHKDHNDPQVVAKTPFELALSHLEEKGGFRHDLYQNLLLRLSATSEESASPGHAQIS
jgi:hypothetical protein